MLWYSSFRVVKRKQKQTKEGEIDPMFWEVLLCAAKKDYERICLEYGVTDFRWMLRKLNQKKKEREEEQSKVSFALSSQLYTLLFFMHVPYEKFLLFIFLSSMLKKSTA